MRCTGCHRLSVMSAASCGANENTSSGASGVEWRARRAFGVAAGPLPSMREFAEPVPEFAEHMRVAVPVGIADHAPGTALSRGVQDEPHAGRIQRAANGIRHGAP